MLTLRVVCMLTVCCFAEQLLSVLHVVALAVLVLGALEHLMSA